jgi:hypothetical protein
LHYGVIALLDALGTKDSHRAERTEVLKERWDRLDEKFRNYISRLRSNLALRKYNNCISSTQVYDNFQIFLPVDETFYHGPIDLSGRNSLWWTVHHIGDY